MNKWLHELPVRPAVFNVEGWDALHPRNDAFWKKYSRMLEYSSWKVAMSTHICNRCRGKIHSGDMYQREVWLYVEGKKREIKIFKYHAPMCPGEEQDFEKEKRSENASKKAQKRNVA